MIKDNRPIVVLGLETSCDDTAAGIVSISTNGAPKIHANAVWTDHDDHKAYGGVVPEIAARSHVERIDKVIARAFDEAGMTIDDISAVCATAGPGLVGGVIVGLTAGKAIAIAKDLPFLPINHLEGHMLSARMTEKIDFPYLALLVSGGHTQLLWIENIDDYQRLGTTIDDAAGEAFDKTAKLLGLTQPGGPSIEIAAKSGSPTRYDFPKPLLRRAGCDFSFSGMKTAVREVIDETELTVERIADIAASFQDATANHLVRQTHRAIDQLGHTSGRLVVAGGVAANMAIREKLIAMCQKVGWQLFTPPLAYCTDNGAMIAWAGAERMAAEKFTDRSESLAMAPRARWPLAAPIAGKEIGGGRKGPKS